MSDNPFTDNAHEPRDEDLANALGRSQMHWNALRKHVAETYPPLTETFKYFGEKIGWSLQLCQRKRTVIWMSPRSKFFLASTSFSEKAVAAARESGLPQEVVAEIEGAKRYAEGRPVRIEVRKKTDYVLVTKIAAIKTAN